MSRPKGYDRIMIAIELAGNAKVGRLNDAEFRCLLTGVWSLAAKSPIRGCLLVGDLEIEPEDVARQARCSPAVARSTLTKMRALGMLERDEEYGCERVHDWDEMNPAPKRDGTAAERQRRRRARLAADRDAAASHAPVTPPVTDPSRRDGQPGHAPEVEVEVELEEESPGGAMSESDRERPPLPPSREELIRSLR